MSYATHQRFKSLRRLFITKRDNQRVIKLINPTESFTVALPYEEGGVRWHIIDKLIKKTNGQDPPYTYVEATGLGIDDDEEKHMQYFVITPAKPLEKNKQYDLEFQKGVWKNKGVEIFSIKFYLTL